MEEEDKEFVKKELDRRLFFLKDYVDMLFISALHGTNVGHIFESIETAYACATRKITTADATKLMQLAVDAHNPPMVGKYRIKLKYAHVGGHNPPVIVIHGNQVLKLPHSYKKYLENFYREALDFRGTPIAFEFKQSENPFADRKPKRLRDEGNTSKKAKFSRG
jgi:GTP-binding protein